MLNELNALTIRGSLGEILERVFSDWDEYVIKPEEDNGYPHPGYSLRESVEAETR